MTRRELVEMAVNLTGLPTMPFDEVYWSEEPGPLIVRLEDGTFSHEERESAESDLWVSTPYDPTKDLRQAWQLANREGWSGSVDRISATVYETCEAPRVSTVSARKLGLDDLRDPIHAARALTIAALVAAGAITLDDALKDGGEGS